MFDIGVSELAVIGVVAMIVIGPEELPRVARTAGHLLGRLRRYVSDVKSDISREMELAELKRMQEQVQESAQDFQHAVKEHVDTAEADIYRTTHADAALPHPLEVNDSIVTSTPATAPQHVEDNVPAPVERDENQMDLFGAPPAAEPPQTGRS